MQEVCFDVQTESHLIPVEPGDLTLAHSTETRNQMLDWMNLVEESGPHLIGPLLI